jgi:hypothetical protein
LLPPQDLSQQTPSTQKVLLQSLPWLQLLPLSSRPHLPSMHLVPITHWLFWVQVVSQAVPWALHTTMGVQVSMAPGTHLPAPSQVEAFLATPPVQLAFAHTVPAG